MPLLFGLVAKSLLKQRGCKDTKSFRKLYGFKNYFLSLRLCLENTFVRKTKKHFDFCSLIRIFAIRLENRSFKMEGIGILKRRGCF